MTKIKTFFYICSFKNMGSYQYWLDNGVKIVFLQFNFLHPSIYDLKTDESDLFSLCISKSNSSSNVHNISTTHKTKKLQFRQLQIHITVYNVKYLHASPFLYNRIPSKLRSHKTILLFAAVQ